ncbi:unnamed protein product [Ceutorhynchus assimilis]|uniref:Uncharacterized protein n=1 Tax=Ceutorhynchus assimilis TaxID=467358 RepID=A0A9N9QM49_9CUCU|nr:unnamed protein product [Ceutorhynchus assimilis]
MEFFGLSQYGVTDPIRDILRDDYKEPTITIGFGAPDQEITDNRHWSEKIRELDCYLGNADGYAYGSQDRLTRMRRKYMWKPVGPVDMYKYPGVNSMNFGWWHFDPELTKLTREQDWYKPRVRNSVVTSEMSRYVNHCLTVDKFFKT